MARYLAVDLDQRQVRVLAVNAGRGGSRLEQAAAYTFAEDLTPSSGESLGKLLRDHLKGQGIQPAPLLASVGRDRVILKEVRFPPVPQNEEAALVRFQASKELTEPASEVVIDYLLLSDRSQPGPRLAMAMVLRRELLQALNALARGLGMKLIGVVPRPIAMAAALERSGRTSNENVAVLNVSDRWAEFCVLRAGRPHFSRSLVTTATLMQDVKRSLRLFAAQEGEADLPQVLYLGGSPSVEVREAWQGAVGLPVQGLDPFQPTDHPVPEAERGAYFSAAGLGHLASAFPSWPVNFARPKEGGPAKGENKNRNRVYAGIAAAVGAILFLGAFFLVSQRRGEVEDLKAQEIALDAQLKELSQDKPAIDALKEFDQSAVSWLDELYDIAATFPQVQGLRITQLNAATLVRKGPEDRFSGRITVHGLVPNGKTKLVDEFVDALLASHGALESKGPGKKSEKTLLVTRERYKPASEAGYQEFQLKIDVAKLPPTAFRAVAVSPHGTSKTIEKPAETEEPTEDMDQ